MEIDYKYPPHIQSELNNLDKCIIDIINDNIPKTATESYYFNEKALAEQLQPYYSRKAYLIENSCSVAIIKVDNEEEKDYVNRLSYCKVKKVKS